MTMVTGSLQLYFHLLIIPDLLVSSGAILKDSIVSVCVDYGSCSL